MECTTIDWRVGDKLIIELDRPVDAGALHQILSNVNSFLSSDQDCIVIPAGMVKRFVVLQREADMESLCRRPVFSSTQHRNFLGHFYSRDNDPEVKSLYANTQAVSDQPGPGRLLRFEESDENDMRVGEMK